MKTKYRQTASTIQKGMMGSLMMIVLFLFQSYAQNARDSSLVKNTNTNWYEQGWVWAVVIAALIILGGIYGSMRNRKNILRDDKNVRR